MAAYLCRGGGGLVESDRASSNGQYAALNSDEQVIASTLVNNGGPEMKAAAKIALAGSADEVHEFVQVGQYMADRKDKLASTHIAQMQRLIAEASGVAAKARHNSWKAAEAAAKVIDAVRPCHRATSEYPCRLSMCCGEPPRCGIRDSRLSRMSE
ncbi:ALF repeat-containing protein [Streptomyces sioyaensis]|uniref:ALF repeat-containing protein n=1 Tax=Streptomyces sioyaensis TaxID=67364 RepID=UPI003797DD27